MNTQDDPSIPFSGDGGYLCEGGVQCPHGFLETHWVTAAESAEEVSDTSPGWTCPFCGNNARFGVEAAMIEGVDKFACTRCLAV